MRDCFKKYNFWRATCAVVCWYMLEPLARRYCHARLGAAMHLRVLPACGDFAYSGEN